MVEQTNSYISVHQRFQPWFSNRDGYIIMSFTNIYDAYYEEQIITQKNGYETLTFKVLEEHVPYPSEMTVERMITCYIGDERKAFRMKKITFSKGENRVITVEAVAFWYELDNGGVMFSYRTNGQRRIDLITTDVANGVGGTTPPNHYVGVWIPGNVPTGTGLTINLNLPKNTNTSLSILRQVQQSLNLELQFDTVQCVVNWYRRIENDTGIILDYQANCKEISRTQDAYKNCTSIWFYGNDGKYLAAGWNWDYYHSNETYFVPMPGYSIYDERFYYSDSAQAYIDSLLDAYSHPSITYDIGQIVVDRLLKCGDVIKISDNDLNIDGESFRVVQRRIQLDDLNKSTYKLNTPLAEYLESLSGSNYIDSFIQDDEGEGNT